MVVTWITGPQFFDTPEIVDAAMAKDEVHSVIGSVDEQGKFTVDPGMEQAFKWMFLRHATHKVVVYCKRFRNRLSKKQRGYYFAVVVAMIGEAMGEDDPEEVHEALKVQCNPKILVGKNDQEARIGGSTKNFDTNEMHEYIERCRKFGADFYDLNIPDPQRVHWDGGGI